MEELKALFDKVEKSRNDMMDTWASLVNRDC